jgi:DNA-binding transcriptional ArsR family regulator
MNIKKPTRKSCRSCAPKSKKGKTIRLPMDFMSRMAIALKILAHPQRLKIVESLQLGGVQPVYSLIDILKVPQPVVSIHLNVLKRAGIVSCQRRGRERWYRLEDPSALTILDCLRLKHKGLLKNRT